MNITATKTERLDISISANDLREIIRTHLVEKHGVSVQPNEMHFAIKTVYDGSIGDPGNDEFAGVEISSIQHQKHTDI